MSLQLPGSGAMTLPAASTVASAPATGDRSLAVATMQKFADEFPALLAASGWQKLPSGFIIQWMQTGTFPADATTYGITFPTAFPVVCYGVSMLDFAANTNAAVPKVSSLSTTGFNASQVQVQGSSTAHSYLVMAVGR